MWVMGVHFFPKKAMLSVRVLSFVFTFCYNIILRTPLSTAVHFALLFACRFRFGSLVVVVVVPADEAFFLT